VEVSVNCPQCDFVPTFVARWPLLMASSRLPALAAWVLFLLVPGLLGGRLAGGGYGARDQKVNFLVSADVH
jgi:hypothetical protein